MTGRKCALKEELTFRDRVFLVIRGIGSLAPKLGLVKKPKHHKKDGVTFIVGVKDEERWIKPCIKSIQHVADEIIIIDSSVEDNTTKIVESLAADNPKIKHIKFYYGGHNAIALTYHIGLASARYKWIFKWDSDLVVKSPEAIQEWVDRLKRLDSNRYYAIDAFRINFMGDLEHLYRSEPFACNGVRIFTWNPELRVELKDNDGEQVIGNTIWGPRFPLYYKVIRWNDPYIFHCNIKNPKRLFIRKYWYDYMIHKDERFKNLEEYAAYRIQQDEGISMEEGIKRLMELIMKDTIPYDNTRFGELPGLIKNV
jgi:glycosyltransferase involved in cell wall biosynthesis